MNREKVIRALNEWKGFGWGEVFTFHHPILEDSLALLKEQEAVEPEWKGGVPFCGNCGHRLQKKNRNMVGINCPMCKRSVKWE